MFRVMELRDGKVTVLEGNEQVAPPAEGAMRWVDLQGQDVGQLELLRERFELHPLAIEDCAHEDQRPKLEEYRDHLFLVTQSFAANGERVEELHLHELHGFLAADYLITVHLDPIATVDRMWQRVAGDPRLLARGTDFVYYLVADGMVDENFPILDSIADELEELEDSVLSAPQRRDLQRIFQLKHHLVHMRKVLSPQRDMIGLMAKRGDPRITDRTALYLRDVYDHLVRINESIEANRDLLGNALEAYLSAVGQRTNEIMKYLTIMSAVFLPLAFIVGFFGQNFDNLPGLPGWMHRDAMMWVMIGLCVATPAAMLTWFRMKRWL